MTFFDGWHALNTYLDASDLTAPTQLVAYKLFAIFNERKFPESLLVSDRELLSRTNLKSTKTIFEARRQLKNAGIFDFAAEPGKTTRYKFGNRLVNSSETVDKQLVNSSETVDKQLVNSSETPEANPNIRVREDVKTLDTLSTSSTTRACAPVNYDIDRLVERWESSGAFGKLDMLIVSKLTALLKSYTCDEILAAMDKAILGNDNKHGINYNYFEAILKGGDKRVRVGGQSRVNHPRILAFAGGRTTSDAGDTQTRPRTDGDIQTGARTGKGRFDDATPDYSWLREVGDDATES